jgi:hypothetical protein
VAKRYRRMGVSAYRRVLGTAGNVSYSDGAAARLVMDY